MSESNTRPIEASGTFQLGDLTVHRLGFGAMRITGPGIWGQPADHDECIRVLRRSIELGIDFIDTADSYGPEVSESLIFEALHPYPSELIIATKAGLTRQGPDQWLPVGRPEYLRQQCEMSLRRLDVEAIDLFQLHLSTLPLFPTWSFTLFPTGLRESFYSMAAPITRRRVASSSLS